MSKYSFPIFRKLKTGISYIRKDWQAWDTFFKWIWLDPSLIGLLIPHTFPQFSRGLEMVSFVVIALPADYNELIHVCFVFRLCLRMKRLFSSHSPVRLFGNATVLSSFGDVEMESQEEKRHFCLILTAPLTLGLCGREMVPPQEPSTWRGAREKELKLCLQPELPKNLDKISAHIQIVFSEHKERKRCFKSVPLHWARLGVRPEAVGLFHLSFPGLWQRGTNSLGWTWNTWKFSDAFPHKRLWKCTNLSMLPKSPPGLKFKEQQPGRLDIFRYDGRSLSRPGKCLVHHHATNPPPAWSFLLKGFRHPDPMSILLNQTFCEL